jgi:hypothetical protein
MKQDCLLEERAQVRAPLKEWGNVPLVIAEEGTLIIQATVVGRQKVPHKWESVDVCIIKTNYTLTKKDEK